MNWTLNSATIIGRDHELSKKNRQDFVSSYCSDDVAIGVVCDGCGESKFSEVGASLIGTFVLNYFKLYTKHKIPVDIKTSLESSFSDFMFSLQRSLLFFLVDQSTQERVDFIREFMLSTCLFCVFIDNKVILGHCGDGIIICNDEVTVINQAGSPHYIAYQSVPKEILDKNPTELKFFQIEILDQKNLNKIIIGTDGIQPLIDKSLYPQVYGTQKRQLQRKFNIWQQEKIFSDDATCLVFEKNYENSSV
jgi:serine/threonine protein phosphatase PrpC